jgi:hypothetical protein
MRDSAGPLCALPGRPRARLLGRTELSEADAMRTLDRQCAPSAGVGTGICDHLQNKWHLLCTFTRALAADPKIIEDTTRMVTEMNLCGGPVTGQCGRHCPGGHCELLEGATRR